MQRFRILVPISFGIQSDVALKRANSIAQQVNGMITCLHVIEKPGFISGKFFSRETEQKARLESELKLASTVNGILTGNDSVSFELIVSSGEVHSKIIEKASELDADMIIMGRSDSTDRLKHSPGANTTRVIERSVIPVLTTSKSGIPLHQHILLPLDLSASVSIQLAKTIEIAALLNAKVTVCTILRPGRSKLETTYRQRLIDIKKLFTQYDIFCRAKLVITENRVVDEILFRSKKYKPDLLLLMKQSEAEIAELSIGSIVYELMCKSEIPVLSVAPVRPTDLYPYKSLFGSINNPINRYDINDHVILTD